VKKLLKESSYIYNSYSVACLVTCIFSLHYLHCLPFSGYTREFNYETVATLISFLIYSQEPWSFPLGQIKSLTFPFEDANVGNVGALPLFAISFKALGTVFDYFKTFDYFVLVDLLSCFSTALFSQKILVKLGVNRFWLRALAALLTGSSLLLINRSVWLQPFCIVAGPIFLMWIYTIICFFEQKGTNWLNDVRYAMIFPIAILLDGYTFFGIMLGTGVLLIREFYEAFFGGLKSSRVRFIRLLSLCFIGVTLSYFALFVIGMYPMPKLAHTFTSYDFGMGGRYHVADLFSTFMPQGNRLFGVIPATLGLGSYFPLTTDILSEGQYEGIAYFGTPVLLIAILYLIFWVVRPASERRPNLKLHYKLTLLSPWTKIAIGVTGVFVFSLGYELHILGRPFPNFNLMPAAWIADRIPSLFNVRAPGRLASLLSFFLILELFRRVSIWLDRPSNSWGCKRNSLRLTNNQINVSIIFLALIHIAEISPFLIPVKAQPLFPIGGVFNKNEIAEIKKISSMHDLVMIAPSVRAADVQWEAEAFSFTYASKLRSNLYYLARTDPKHDQRIARDLQLIESGKWKLLQDEYQQRILIVIPIKMANKLRSLVDQDFEETIVGPVSVWSKKT
jgi:hypothetical protein